MIENLNGIHETVNYKNDMNTRLYLNVEQRIILLTGIFLLRSSCLLKTDILSNAKNESFLSGKRYYHYLSGLCSRDLGARLQENG